MQALLGSLLSYPLPVATLSFNPANGLQTAQIFICIAAADQLSDVFRATWTLAWIYTHTSSIGQAIEHQLHFNCPTRARGNSDLCVDDGYFLRLLSVDTSPLTYFSPFPNSASEYTHDDRERPTSIVDLTAREPCRFLYFREAPQLWAFHGQLSPDDYFWKRRKHQQTDKTENYFALNRRSVSPLFPACVRAVCSRCDHRIVWQRRDFLSNRKYRYRPHLWADVGDCWPWSVTSIFMQQSFWQIVVVLLRSVNLFDRFILSRATITQDQPLDLSFWSFLTFCIIIDRKGRHFFVKTASKFQYKSWPNVPPKFRFWFFKVFYWEEIVSP